MFFVLSKLLDIFLSPLTWSLLFLALAIPWRRARRYAKRKRVFGAIGLAILLFASSPPVANMLQSRLEHAAPSTYRPDVTYDAVVLLGGVLEEAPTAESGMNSYNENVERLLVTEKLLREGHAKVAIISSAPLDPSHPEIGEAVVLAKQLHEWGIAEDRLVIEDKARNTRENAVYSQRLTQAMHLERVLIVTSAFHMPRARECFAAVAMPVDTLAVDYRSHASSSPLADYLPRAGALHITTAMLREMAGRYIYRAQGYGKAL